jgi:hypothetical protein
MISMQAAQFLDPIRDIYEAFTIYTFFQLLINYLGGERSLLIMTHGREPVHHLWPLNHVLSRVDISDPYTFLAIKRGILQYAWLKPILGLAAIIMKATGTYQEGYIGVTSGYFWSGLIYNVSVTVSLYSLGLFWVCMNKDLTPFRPIPKFLCIKLIIFASYWQGFFLSILVWLGALPDDVQGYTPDNLAAAIQDALICIEMPIFAVAHWYAFSWKDYADNTVHAARMPVKYAFRDSFGVRDLIQDSRETLKGDKYAYRAFDSGDKVMAHEASRSRLARIDAGMRYQRGGKGKYWLPRPGEINPDVNPYTPLLGGGSGNGGGPSRSNSNSNGNGGLDEETALDDEEERLYDKARKLEYGDWNVSQSCFSIKTPLTCKQYPVIPANEPRREDRWRSARPSAYQAPTSHDSGGSGSFLPAALRTDEPLPAVIKPKKKGKQKHGAPTTAGRSTSPGGTPRPGVQAPAKPDADETDELDVARDERAGSPPPRTTSLSPTAEESSPWGVGDNSENEDDAAGTVSPKYDIEESEGFRNVWDSTHRPDQQGERKTHL